MNNKLKKYWYEIPLKQRYTNIRAGGPAGTLKEVDGVGIFVFHDPNSDISDQNIRKHLIGVQSRRARIQADNPREALRIFFKEYEGATIGKKAVALWVETDRWNHIKEIPVCQFMKVNPSGHDYCSLYDEADYNFGCWLDGYDWDTDVGCTIYDKYCNISDDPIIRKYGQFTVIKWKINAERK